MTVRILKSAVLALAGSYLLLSIGLFGISYSVLGHIGCGINSGPGVGSRPCSLLEMIEENFSATARIALSSDGFSWFAAPAIFIFFIAFFLFRRRHP